MSDLNAPRISRRTLLGAVGAGAATASMAWAVEKGVISGSDGKLLPNSPCTRAEAAAMLANLL